jgi:hypothetical protein
VTSDVRGRAIVDQGSSSVRTARRVGLSKRREALLAKKVAFPASSRRQRFRGDTKASGLYAPPNERASDSSPTKADDRE